MLRRAAAIVDLEHSWQDARSVQYLRHLYSERDEIAFECDEASNP